MNDNVAFIHMTSTEPSVILAIAKYIFTCFNKRMQSIYDVYYLNQKC